MYYLITKEFFAVVCMFNNKGIRCIQIERSKIDDITYSIILKKKLDEALIGKDGED
jgi:hypothetical protein